jgi:hypothetical protein
MLKGSRRLALLLPLLAIGLSTGVALADDIILVPPDVDIREGDREVEITWRDPQPEKLVVLLDPVLGTAQYAWRGVAHPVLSGFYVGACDWDILVTVNSLQDSVGFTWQEISDWNTKATRTRRLRVDETDLYYDLSAGIRVAVPSTGLFDYDGAGWSGPEPNFHGIYRGGTYPDTSVVFTFTCASGGQLTAGGDAAISLSWYTPGHAESGSVTIVRAGQSVEVSRGLRVFFPAGQFTAGQSFTLDARVPFGKVGPGGDPPNDAFKVRAQTFDGYMVLRRSVEDRTSAADTMYKVIADIERCDNPAFFADDEGNQDPSGDRRFIDKGVHGSGTGVTPDSTARVIINGFPYDYAVVTYDWGTDYNVHMSPIQWTKVYPAAAPATSADAVYVAPNPYLFRAGWEQGEAKLQFLNVPSGATIKIFDAAGGYIDTVTPNRRLDADETGSADWNLRDSDGKQIVSGIYIFRVESAAGDRMGRFVVVR